MCTLIAPSPPTLYAKNIPGCLALKRKAERKKISIPFLFLSQDMALIINCVQAFDRQRRQDTALPFFVREGANDIHTVAITLGPQHQELIAKS